MCLFAAERHRLKKKKKKKKKKRPAGCQKNTPLHKQPPAENQRVGVLKLSGPVECNFPAGFLLMFGERSAKVSRNSMDLPPVSGHGWPTVPLRAAVRLVSLGFYFVHCFRIEKLRLSS